MSDGFEIGSARLTVLLDLRHPLAYLALKPTRALIRDLGSLLEPAGVGEVGAGSRRGVDWLPIAGPTLKSPSAPGADDDRGIRHRRWRAQAIAREIEVYGAAQGLVIRDFYRDADATAANCAWLWVRERQPDRLEDFLDEMFRDYWALELDPADGDAVAALVEQQGADAAGYRSWSMGEGERVEASLADEIRNYGLFQAPAFLVEDEVFYGRQHLPMIRWILEGRRGAVPI